ncbi:sugar ABC transporter permease [Spirochaetia bacterium]|nr:sugar ABC transporter permease [Spirochaetia bacterium]
MHTKQNFFDRIVSFIIIVILSLLCFSMLYPFWNSVVIAFNDSRDTVAGGLSFWPRKFTLENVGYVLQDPRIANAFLITIARTGVGTLVSVLITAIMAFSLSRPQLKMRKVYMALAVFTMYFSGGMIPTYILIRNLGLRNNFLVYILPMALNVWNMIIFRSFFNTLPSGLLESAKMDGAGWYTIFFRIVIPVSLPVFATLSLFTAVGQWNAWFDAALYISKPELMPIQTILNTILNTSSMRELMSKLSGTAATALKNSGVSSRAVTMATMVVSTTPILLVYPFIQRYFVSGVMIGSLKE